MSDFPNFSNWSMYALTDLAHYHNGFAFKPKDWAEDGVKIIRIEQLNKPDGEYDRYAGMYPLTNQINDGDLIFSWSATLKVVIWNHGSAVLNQHLFRVDEKDGFEKQYIYYILDHHMDSLAGGSHGSTMKHIKRGELQKYRVSVPPLDCQKKIASILSTIDQTIAHTEALIQKYQQIKAGLMHDLFTRGITSDGQLRPPREQAPELYRDSAIGWIPREWSWGALSKYLNGTPKNGYSPREIDEWNGCFSLGLGCLTLSGYKAVQLKSVDLRSAIASGALLEDGDFLVSRANTPQLVGLCGVYQEMSSPCIYPDLMIRIQPNKLVYAKYLEQYLLSAEVRIRLTALAVGTSASMVKLNSKSLMNFIVAIPKEEEQKLIIKKSEKISNYLNSLESSCSKLKEKKSGLMQDLLTGKVPVTISES